MKEKTQGSFTTFNGERYYKIANYDQMDDFFMTITSSSDIWNFIWSKGGITAGRINSDYMIFPYYTADKLSDGKTTTGSFSMLKVTKNGKVYKSEPFASLRNSILASSLEGNEIKHNLYKNVSGTRVWFEEINEELELAFRIGWTSSAKYGLVRCTEIQNLSDSPVSVEVLDGCRNILPAHCDRAFIETNSYLLDAYKKSDLDTEANFGIFTVSSIVSDKAEPNEGLRCNVSWFSTNDTPILDPEAPAYFVADKEIRNIPVLKGKRASFYIDHKVELSAKDTEGSKDSWYQIFDTSLNHSRVAELKNTIKDKAAATKDLEKDIADGIALMNKYVSESDGIQETSDEMASTHHYANVMFNIMRGGVFLDAANISKADFMEFINSRNKKEAAGIKALVEKCPSENGKIARKELEKAVYASGNAQAIRLFLEYMPITFSRRHGDPSRPWNRFNIRLRDENNNPILNYEGNWRDIFQNWESLSFSYPEYIKNIVAKFLNAMTAEGYNPYRIGRDGLDWEIPDPNNPWAQIGYWGDHQVIYLEKLLELWNKTNSRDLKETLNKEYYSTAKVPFIIKPYAELKKDPRHSIVFDRDLSNELIKKTREYGSDVKLIRTKKDDVALVSLTAKLIQIVLCKACNLIPGGGIWLNTQRPEWNDANNALAGYGLSMVTVCYLRRYLSFLTDMYSDVASESFTLPKETAECFTAISKLYMDNDVIACSTEPEKRNAFSEKAGVIFQKEYETLYNKGYSGKTETVTGETIISRLKAILNYVDYTIKINKRQDGLYHSYNTLVIEKNAMHVKTLQEMLEGQVAVISSGLLSEKETLELVKSLKESRMFEKNQYSYMLYPDKELPMFEEKNCVSKADAEKLSALLERTKGKLLVKDINDVYHFNSNFMNANTVKKFISELPADMKPTETETEELLKLYEKTFNHQDFTGRSGTFYAFEGLGSIYWHMVAKLLLAVQEYAIRASDEAFKGAPDSDKVALAKELALCYYDIRKGIGYNKTPEVYGAFPSDPYSHTPSMQGAKQPGMTGQVKEEILTRWGELGISVDKGIASFNPHILLKSEFSAEGKLSFTWCGTKVVYVLGNENKVTVTSEGKETTSEGCKLSSEQTEKLFARNGSIDQICVTMNLAENLM